MRADLIFALLMGQPGSQGDIRTCQEGPRACARYGRLFRWMIAKSGEVAPRHETADARASRVSPALCALSAYELGLRLFTMSLRSPGVSVGFLIFILSHYYFINIELSGRAARKPATRTIRRRADDFTAHTRKVIDRRGCSHVKRYADD